MPEVSAVMVTMAQPPEGMVWLMVRMLVVGKGLEDPGEDTGLIIELQLIGEDSADHHFMEGHHTVTVLIKGTAADIRNTGCFIDGLCLAGGQEPLGLHHFQKNLRQRGRFYNIILRSICHNWHRLRVKYP